MPLSPVSLRRWINKRLHTLPITGFQVHQIWLACHRSSFTLAQSLKHPLNSSIWAVQHLITRVKSVLGLIWEHPQCIKITQFHVLWIRVWKNQRVTYAWALTTPSHYYPPAATCIWRVVHCNFCTISTFNKNHHFYDSLPSDTQLF